MLVLSINSLRKENNPFISKIALLLPRSLRLYTFFLYTFFFFFFEKLITLEYFSPDQLKYDQIYVIST